MMTAASEKSHLRGGRGIAAVRAESRSRRGDIALDWTLEARALDRWDPAVLAPAAPDAMTNIDILDVIGSDMFGDGISAAGVRAALDSSDGGDVNVTLNTPGGDFFEGVAIAALLANHPGRVVARVIGLAASAGAIVLAAADEVEIAPSAFVMIHQAWGLVIGSADEMREAAGVFDRFDTAQVEAFVRRSGQPEAQVREWLEAETWFLGQEAIDAGFADALMDAPDRREAPEARSRRAIREVDRALASAGASRSRRNALLKEMKAGTPGAAAATAAPEAGNWTPAARSLLATLRR